MDPRIVRTRRKLQEALFALANERGIDDVTVSDIAEHAEINRTTFYQHYSDKETLLADAFSLVAAEAGAQLGEVDVYSARPPQALVAFLEHARAHASLYHRVFTEPGYGAVLGRLHDEIEAAVARAPQDDLPSHDLGIPDRVVAAGMAGLISGVISSWLAEPDQATPDVAATWIWALIQGPQLGMDAQGR